MLRDEEKKTIIDRYNKRLENYGYSTATLGWGTGLKARHKLRYHILLSHWDIRGKDILDFGCGFGDMYGFLQEQEKNHSVNYFGIDINEKLISEGKKQYPNANLQAKDIFTEGISRDYDYIFSSGTHNTKIIDNWSFVESTFELFNQSTKCGFALNFLSDKVDFMEEGAFYYSPSRILDFAYKYSNRVLLRNDYMPFEFTVFIDKNNLFDKDLVIYSEFKKYI